MDLKGLDVQIADPQKWASKIIEAFSLFNLEAHVGIAATPVIDQVSQGSS
jgi:hypothetical protein